MMAPVLTTGGAVVGSERDGVHSFFGVPYAAPPVGDFRFRPPAPPIPWSGERRADTPGPTVPQSTIDEPLNSVFSATFPAGDDCLNLNIWTPGPGPARLPVLVFIHGGGYQVGAGSDPVYDGTAFARDGIVCVTLNYRLGAQGFLWIDGVEGAGCFGLLDQIAALSWVQENIAAFGGDPGNVTVAGESAGGMSVATLMTVPAARGLFHRAIVQSGSAHAAVSPDTARSVTACLGDVAGVDPADVEAWRALPLAGLLAAEQTVASKVLARRERRVPELATTPAPMAFQPVFGTPVLPALPIEALQQGAGAGIDLLTGACAEEMYPVVRAWPQQFGVQPGEEVPESTIVGIAGLMLAGSRTSPQDLVAAYRDLLGPVHSLDLIGELLTAWAFRLPGIALAEAQARQARVFLYELAWPGSGSWGAGHVLDVPLVFDTCGTATGRFLAGDTAPADLVATIHGAWCSFVAFGDPRHQGLPTWPGYDTTTRACMRLDQISEVVDGHRLRERQIWEHDL